MRALLKRVLVAAGMHGVLPVPLVDWLIQRGGLSHD